MHPREESFSQPRWPPSPPTPSPRSRTPRKRCCWSWSWPLALGWSIHLSLAITLLLVILTVSYRQTIHAHPSGGGSYVVAKANLGELPGLTAAAALMGDYVLTVSVSVAAGVAALTSAVPALYRP